MIIKFHFATIEVRRLPFTRVVGPNVLGLGWRSLMLVFFDN